MKEAVCAERFIPLHYTLWGRGHEAIMAPRHLTADGRGLWVDRMGTAHLNVFPDRVEFSKLCRPGRAVAVRAEIDADTDTPISAFLKLSRGEPHAFLFESVEGGERSGRLS